MESVFKKLAEVRTRLQVLRHRVQATGLEELVPLRRPLIEHQLQWVFLRAERLDVVPFMICMPSFALGARIEKLSTMLSQPSSKDVLLTKLGGVIECLDVRLKEFEEELV